MAGLKIGSAFISMGQGPRNSEAAESYNYKGMDGENANLFPEAVTKWAAYNKAKPMQTQQTEQMEWQKLSDTPEGYSLWTKLDDTGREIFKYERTQPKATEGGYYDAKSAAKLKNLTPNKAQNKI